MALRLRVTGPKAARLGDSATRVFGVHGGRVGRGTDNDWPLPDPERYLSGHHASVEYRAGVWYVADHSSNGTYLNDASVPIGRGHAVVVRTGDRVRMGAYTFMVTVSPDNDFPPDLDAAVAPDFAGPRDFSLATTGDLGADIDINHLITDPVPAVDEPRSRTQTFVDEVGPVRTRVLDPHAYRQRLAERTGAPPGGSRRAPADNTSTAVQAFCRGAGIDPAQIGDEANNVLTLAGQLVRELALGLIAGMQYRSEQTSRFQVEDTSISLVQQNPFRMTSGVEESLMRVFAPRSARFLAPLDAVRSSFADLRRHDQATQIAIQDALAEYLKRLAPEQLELQFGDNLARAQGAPQNPASRYWDMYKDLYRVVTQMSPQGLPHAFEEDFAKAYETANSELNDNARRATPLATAQEP